MSVNTSDTITDDDKTIPTTKAVYDAISPIQNSINDLSESVENDLSESVEEINSNYKSSDVCLKSIAGNGDFVFNNYDPEIHTLGNHQGYTLVFTKKHFYTGKLLNIIIPHNSGGSDVSGGYLAIQVYKELNNESEEPITYYSENSCDYVPSADGYKFNFVNCFFTSN